MPTHFEAVTIEGDPHLEAFVVKPKEQPPSAPAVVLCHGLPSAQRPGTPNLTYRQFAERIADAQGWTVLAVSLRGCGESDGNFSMEGWITDVGRCVDRAMNDGANGVWLVGSTTGGSLAILTAARDSRVRGVAAMAARTDFDDWAGNAKRFLEHCRGLGIISDPTYPVSVGNWIRELRTNKASAAVAHLSDRPLLILHGNVDRQVPYTEAVQLARRHNSAELRVIDGADHRIRHDPRAIAVLLGWLERQLATRYDSPATGESGEAGETGEFEPALS